MRKPPLLSSDILSVLRFDENTGKFFWKARDDRSVQWNRRFSGKEAGGTSHGYAQISINGKFYKSHQLVWLLSTGEWPPSDIDHKDMCKSNNLFSNLRLATMSENLANTTIRKTNTSGRKGVSWSSNAKKWMASISVNYKTIYLGYFFDINDAANAYDLAAQKYYGSHALLNKDIPWPEWSVNS